MNINRHNYETYFILYMDNELDAAGRQQVEAFVQLHPDLKEELELLEQFKLIPDEQVVFAGKEELLKGQSAGPVTLQNYEEYLLLYTDNELNAADTAALEKFASENLAVKKELDLLQFTRLQPEPVIFPDKQSLYRAEEKVRALPVRWWRAAAAVLILGGGITVALLINSNRSGEETAAVNPDAPGKQKVTPALKTPDTGLATADLPGTKTQTDKVVISQEPVQTTAFRTKNTPVPKQPVQQVLQQNNPVVVANNDKPSNNLPQPVNNPNYYNPGPDKAVAQLTNNANKKDPDNSLTNNPVTNPVAAPSDDYKTAALTETETAADGKKNKLRGFFRKVTRTIEKRTNIDPTDEDNRLLVGGLSIKLK